ncbi:MAG TPA: XylR family transcriptional regulator [Planctomycetota bacterium]
MAIPTSPGKAICEEPRRRRIALLLGQDLAYCRGVMLGAQNFALEKAEWVFRDAPPEDGTLEPLREWKPHGIIAHLFSEEVARALARLRIPVINVTSTLAWWTGPLVEVDHLKVGQLAAEHFLARGFRSFGYFGSAWTGFSRQREQGFRERVQQEGFQVSSCYADYLPRAPLSASWRGVDRTIARWLEGLPKPVAVFASNDIPARDLADTCRQLALRIPEQVALLGVDNDELECRLTYPPLSSVENPAQRIGYEAARLLDALMNGRKPASVHISVPPARVVTRQSSDTLAIEDDDVSRTLTYIRAHAHADGLSVQTVADVAAVSRRMLERKFRSLLGRTVLQEIRRVKIERVQQLLLETALPMPEIARRSGFSSPQRMAVVFAQITGEAPTDYRTRSRLAGGAPAKTQR